MKKALVISGGGSKGAFAGGVAQYLMKHEDVDCIQIVLNDVSLTIISII